MKTTLLKEELKAAYDHYISALNEKIERELSKEESLLDVIRNLTVVKHNGNTDDPQYVIDLLRKYEDEYRIQKNLVQRLQKEKALSEAFAKGWLL